MTLEKELQQFYQSVDIVVNVGQKVETLAPMQMISNGAFYIGPRFDHPVGRAPGGSNLATNPFGSLPSFSFGSNDKLKMLVIDY